jgi:hypothetical protein
MMEDMNLEIVVSGVTRSERELMQVIGLSVNRGSYSQ